MKNQIEIIKNISLPSKIEGRFLNKIQAQELQKEIEANYTDNLLQHFNKEKNDIRMNMFNYNNPIAEKNLNGINLRIAEGLIRNRRKTYLLYADGKIIGEFYSVNDIKMIVNYIENNLIKNTIKEEVTETEIICDKCNHRWDIDKGGEDLYVCHECGHDNTPKKKLKKKIKEELQSNANIVIRQITKDDLKQIIPRLGEVFNKTGLPSQQIWSMMQHSDFNKSIVATVDDNVAGFYFFSNDQIPYIEKDTYYELEKLNGIEGVALGVLKEYKNLGIGKKLIEYPKSMPNVDYIWGYQLKSLQNIDDWLKRRNIYAEGNGMYITYQLFNKPLSEKYKIKEEENILNEKCWKGYTQKGMKTMFGKQYPNCVKSKK
jgi:hypothetical protein